MRLGFAHLLVALLIAVFAIGAPLPVQADCQACEDCTTEAPAKNDIPCPEKGLACQIASTCVIQIQKAPAQITIQSIDHIGTAAFARATSFAIKSAFVRPETAPPRL